MNETYLAHHGIKGQKWGVRRFQNADGSYTNAGKTRYGDGGGNTKSNKSFPTKKVVAGALVGIGLATAAVLYARNPKAVNDAISKVGRMSVNAINSAKDKIPSYKNSLGEYRTMGGALTPRNRKLTDLEKKTIRDLRIHDIKTAPKRLAMEISKPVKGFGKGVGEGLKSGVANFPKNTGKMVGEGAIALVGMTAINRMLGEANTNKMITAYNNGRSKDKKYKNVKLDEKSFQRQAKKDFSPKKIEDDDDA